MAAEVHTARRTRPRPPPLKDWAVDLLDEKRLREDGFFDVAAIRAAWNEHQSGRRNWQYHLWAATMFQAWKSRWM